MKARSKRTTSIFLLSAVFCLFLSSCENPFMQQIMEYKTVSFNTNGGSSVPAQNLVKGWKITRPDDPVKPDFVFDGWYSDNDTFLHKWDFDDIPAADMTLHAKWSDDDRIQITYAAVHITAPEVDQVPATGAELDEEGGANYSIVAVSWSPDDNLFLQNTQYTVSITLMADDGYTFRDLADAFINGQAAEPSGYTVRTVTLSLTFEPTDEIVDFDLQAAVNEYQNATVNMIIKVPGSLILTENITVPANVNDYTLTITSDRSSPYTIYRGRTDTNIEDNSGLFIVTSGAKLIFENIVINGNKSTHAGNNASLVSVETGGEFTLGNGAVLKNNKASVGGGVFVDWGGIFNMEGGIISGNEAATNGGGVFVAADNQGGGGVFNMEGGTISGNEATTNGGGVFVAFFARFTISDSEISGNKAMDGGGVYAMGNSNMKDNAKVSGNIATGNGGGVYINNRTFSMEDGTISGNQATSGGGVYVNGYGEFEISNGILYGNNEGVNSNTAATDQGAALYVFYLDEDNKGTAQCVGSTATSLNTRDETIKVANGALQ